MSSKPHPHPTPRPAARAGTVLTALLAAALATGVAAVPIDFHPDRNLLPLRLFPHDGDVVVTWGRYQLSIIDAESLAIADLERSSWVLEPMPVPGHEAFFYLQGGPAPDRLTALYGREKVVLAEQVVAAPWTAVGGNLFFTTWNPGLDVRVSDGTPEGTGILFDPDPGWVYSCPIVCPPFNSPSQMQVAPNGRIYILTEIGDGFQVWTRDPATEFPGLPPVPQPAFRRLLELPYEPAGLFAMADGRLFFFGAGPGLVPVLWVSDGSPAGTVPVLTLPATVGNPHPAHLRGVELDGQLYFLAENAGERQLWRSDGTAEGTVVAHDFGRGPSIAALWKGGDRFYLPVDADGLGEELWTSDGTAAGTRRVADIRPGSSGSRPRPFAVLPDGRFAISLDDGVHGPEPFISDGTAEGTRLIADALPGPLGSDPAEFAVAGNRLFFAGSNAAGRRTPSYVELPLPPACPDDRLCLLDRRFEVETFFTTADGNGKGRRTVGSDQTGVFSFFSPDNWEVMIKVLDGCSINDRFWVFASAATDVRYELRVTDLETGVVRSYQHGGGGPAPAITDIDAFDTCIGSELGEAEE